MNKHIKIYEIDAMTGLTYEEMYEWRNKLKKLLINYASYYSVDLTVINPVEYYNFEEKKYQNDKEVMQFDLSHVKTSDIVIVKLDGLHSSIGSCIEVFEAYTRGIPVIALGNNEEYQNLHPWIKECITRTEETHEQVASYIRDFYFIC